MTPFGFIRYSGWIMLRYPVQLAVVVILRRDWGRVMKCFLHRYLEALWSSA
jgi:DNA polymerase elongation subunit (family B)